jgi:hypothetical protein
LKLSAGLLGASADQSIDQDSGVHGPSAGSRHANDVDCDVVEEAVKYTPSECAVRSAALQRQGNFGSSWHGSGRLSRYDAKRNRKP